MGSRTAMLEAIYREFQKQRMLNRQMILTLIYVRLDLSPEAEHVPEMQSMVDDLTLGRGQYRVEDLAEAINKNVKDTISKNILRDLLKLLTA